MAEIDIFRLDGEPILSAKSGNINIENSHSKDTDIQRWGRNKVFEIREKGRKFEYISYFNARENSGGRGEQFIAVYKGTPESPKEFENQVEQVMREADSKTSGSNNIFHKFTNNDRNFLVKMANARGRGPQSYDGRRVERELESNQKMDFAVPNPRSAAELAKWMEELEFDSNDKNFSMSVTRNKKGFDSEVNILIDDSVNRIKPLNKEANKSRRQTNQGISGNNTDNWTPPGRRKPSGPGEWIKSKIPFL